jgi:hypothetical protein
LVYYTEIQSKPPYISLHISFEAVPLDRDTLLPTFVKLLEVFLETILDTSGSAFVIYAETSSALASRCPFRTISSSGKKKKFGGDKPMEHDGRNEE